MCSELSCIFDFERGYHLCVFGKKSKRCREKSRKGVEIAISAVIEVSLVLKVTAFLGACYDSSNEGSCDRDLN